MELNQLLQTDPAAASYFHALPAGLRDALYQRGDEIDSLSALRSLSIDLSRSPQADPPVSPGESAPLYATISESPLELQKWCETHQL